MRKKTQPAPAPDLAAIMRKQIDAFLRSPARNLWIEPQTDVCVYLRKSGRHLDPQASAMRMTKPAGGGPLFNCLDIATVTINDEALQQRGIFSTLLSVALEQRETQGVEYLYIENSSVQGLNGFLNRLGFRPERAQREGEEGWPSSFFVNQNNAALVQRALEARLLQSDMPAAPRRAALKL